MRPFARALFAFSAAALALAVSPAGCGDDDERQTGSEPDGRAARPPTGIDSAKRFTGLRAEVAALIEGFEAAVRADDRGAMCRAIAPSSWAGYRGGARESPYRGTPERVCLRDPDNDPAAELSRHGRIERYDLVVEAVRIANPCARPGVGCVSPDLRYAIARVTVRGDGGPQLEEFQLARSNAEWAITVRRFTAPPQDAPFALTCQGSERVEALRQPVRAPNSASALANHLPSGQDAIPLSVTYGPPATRLYDLRHDQPDKPGVRFSVERLAGGRHLIRRATQCRPTSTLEGREGTTRDRSQDPSGPGLDCRRTDSRTADLPPPSNWSPGAVRYVRVERSTRVLHRYARRHRDTFAGLYLEGAPDWTTIHVGFTGHLEAHEGRLRELYPYPAILRLFRACATEEELEHLQDRIPIGEKELRISTVGRDVKRNVVEVTFMQYDEDVARELRHRFGHALRVVRRDVIVRPLSSTARGPRP